MPALAFRLSDRQLKAVKAKDKDYVLSNGSMLWNFNYREPVTKKRRKQLFATDHPRVTDLKITNAASYVTTHSPAK